MELVDRFQHTRPRLVSMAHRMLGSRHDAEDAVQTAWLRVQSADVDGIANLDGWLTTVTSRICLDQLSARERRRESMLPFDHDAEPGAEAVAVDEEFLRREDVSRALVVLLGELSAAQRVAYVLHDLFAVPFDDVAAVLDTSRDAAKKLASRARAAVRGAEPDSSGATDELVSAFLAAARGGDLDRLVELLAPDAVRTVDRRLLPPSGAGEVRGARNIAEETELFAGRIAVTEPVRIGGRAAAVIAPGGRALALITFTVRDGVIAEFVIESYRPGALLSRTTA